jgi:lysyl-tRNA synthetase class 2
MVIQASRLLQAEGSEYMSLNFASLSSTEASITEPRAITSLRRFLFDNLSSIYQLKTLYQFNSKFEPEWSSRYLVYGDLMRTGKVMLAVIQAEDPIKFSTLAAVFRRS